MTPDADCMLSNNAETQVLFEFFPIFLFQHKMECNLNLSSLHNVSLTSSTFVFTGEDGESTSVPFADTSTDQILCVMLGGPKQVKNKTENAFFRSKTAISNQIVRYFSTSI